MTLPTAPAPAAPPVTRASSPWASHAEVLAHHAATRPDDLALAWLPRLDATEASFTYAALDQRVRAVAARLQALGAAGEPVLLVLDNDPAYVVAFLACAYAGAIAVTLHAPSRPKHLTRLAHVAADAGAKLVLATGPIAGRFRAGMDALPGLAGTPWLLVDEVPAAAAAAYVPHRPAAADVAFLQYTSGSTGAPRGVVVAHGDLMYQGAYMQALMGFTPADRALTWWPLFHDMGLILGTLQPLYTGFPLHLTSPVAFVKDPAGWLRAIGRLGITFSGGPNFAFDLAVDAVDPRDLAGVDLSRWQIALNGAEPVRAATLDRFTAAFGPLGFRATTHAPAYGLAEATLAVTMTGRGAGPARRRVASAALAAGRIADDPAGRELVGSGRPLPDTIVRIVDPATGEALPADRVGEIWVAASGLARGYWRRPAETEATFGAALAGEPGPWLRTGDLGFRDAAGELYITSRLKDLIVVAGKNHYPSDLEQTAEAADPALRANFAIAFAAERGDREVLVVLAEVRPERVAGLDGEAVGRAVMRQVRAEHEIAVDEVWLLAPGQVPKTTSGKLQRALGRETWAAGGFEPLCVVRREAQA